MKLGFLIAIAVGGLGVAQAANAMGTLVHINGTDVSGTTEYIWYVTGSRYTLLGATEVNTTVPYGPYAYTTLFYLPSEIPLSSVVVMNQGGTKQVTFTASQVVPVGTVIGGTPTPPTQPGDTGGMLLNIKGSDVGGTTEYVWSNVAGTYTLLGSGSVNANSSYGAFAYNVSFYLPHHTPANTLVVTNQAGSPQTGYVLQQALPRGPATAVPAQTTTRVGVATAAAQSGPVAGQLFRAHGVDVSGTTEYVWDHVGSTYTLLGTGPTNATNPHTPYGYNVLFFRPQGSYARNVVVTNQAGTVQRGVVFDGKTPTVLAPPT